MASLQQEVKTLQMRHELKYGISRADHHILSARLSKLFPCDAHAAERGEYRVRSLYFDTPGDHALLDKINGVSYRAKFRLRLYDGDTGFIRLEKKIKANGMCQKQSAPLTKGETERLIAGDFDWLRTNDKELLNELYEKMRGQVLRPKTIVEYVRAPFVFPAGNVRVTLDRDIRTGLACTRFLDPAPPMFNTFEDAVLEVKYDNYLPDIIAQAVYMPNRRQEAFSKYAACRKFD